MKRYSNLYNVSISDINEIYKEVRKNTKNKNKIYKFEQFYSLNISKIKEAFDNNYKCGKYNIFLIKDPKYRIIMSQNMYDKIINHIVSRKFLFVLEKSLINTNIATRKGKGTSYGIKYLKKYLNELDSPIYALKFDISKYFYNIDHNILINLVKTKIKDENVINILTTIIDSTNYNYINKKINKLKENEILKIKNSNLNNKLQKIKEIQKIPIYEKGKGLPIGNMSSQILAVYYLNELDHFIKEKLKVKYIRYMDDGVLLSNDKNYLKYCLLEIEKIIKKYKLSSNNKTKIINVSKEGIDFLGFRFYKKNNVVLKVRNSTKRKFKRKIKLIKKGIISKEKSLQIINGYKAHLKWGNSFNLLSIIKVKKS